MKKETNATKIYKEYRKFIMKWMNKDSIATNNFISASTFSWIKIKLKQ